MAAAGGGDGHPAHSREALAELCALYWFPLYSFIRRRGYGAEDAQDLTQGFFAHLLERGIIGTADPVRGRFRSYLLGACKHFLADERDRSQALKRGGGRATLSRDAEQAEARYALEAWHGETPERLFERNWAMTLLRLALADLRTRYEQAGKAESFERLKGFLTVDPPVDSQAAVATQLGSSAGAVRVALHRLRRDYRAALRRQIEQTVASPGDVDDEIRALFSAVRG